MTQFVMTLTRKQIEQLKEFIDANPGDLHDDVSITYGHDSAIGTNVYATLDRRENPKKIDITDYENW